MLARAKLGVNCRHSTPVKRLLSRASVWRSREMRHDLVSKGLQIVSLGEAIERKLYELKALLVQLCQSVSQLGRVAGEGWHVAVEPRPGPSAGRGAIPVQKDGERA